jgi:hypothetical protein
MMVAVGLSWIAFIMLKYVPSIPSFFRAFFMRGCWILSKDFYVSIEIIMRFLCLNLFVLQMLNNPWISGMKLTCSWCMTFLMCCWVQSASILLRFLCLFSLKELAYNSFGCCVLVWFRDKYKTGFMEWVWQSFFAFYFIKSLRTIGISFFLKAWYNSEMNPSNPGLFFVGRLYYCFNFIACYKSI